MYFLRCFQSRATEVFLDNPFGLDVSEAMAETKGTRLCLALQGDATDSPQVV